MPVTVTDDKGRFVSNLVKKDFRVLDEGKPQNIEFFTHDEKQPIVAGFLVDLSNNSRIHWKTYQDAILELVWNLLPGDKRYTGYLISYGNTADIAVNTTWDSDKIADKVRKMKPGGGAALLRRHLPGLHAPRTGERRTLRAAARHHRDRRRPR